jgi:dipeptidyl-peptidase-4
LREETNIYIPRIFWTTEGDQLAVMQLNRHQNFMELLMTDAQTGEGKVVITDKDEAWVDVKQEVAFLQQKEQIVWTSEKSGFRHIYIHDYAGNAIRQVTDGIWEVTDIVGIDERDDWVYFYGKKDSHLEQNLYRVKLNGKKPENISEQDGWHTAIFSPDYKYYVEHFSNVSTPTQISLRKSDGTLVRMLEENKIDAMKDHPMVFPEFLTFTTTDGTELYGYIMKPHDFDPAKKYPVLVYGYGGPGSQIVLNRWGGDRTLWHQYMTEQGYIVFCVDNRGTGGRGKTFKNLAYGDLSQWAVHDQIEGAKYLATLPYVDADRLGFWGWSGGGYLTLMMLTRGAEYFKAGVSVAPVSDFRLYDTIWTERYMGLPSENEKGYDAANTLKYAGLLEGDLLIVHGTGDDNVHYQNTLQMINELQAQNKQFEMMLYANRNHRISGGNTQLHLFNKISNFLQNNL